MDEPPILTLVGFSVLMVTIQRTGLIDQLFPSAPSSTQATEISFRQSPTIIHTCQLSSPIAVGEYDLTTNTIKLCRERVHTEGEYVFTKEHELAHAYLHSIGKRNHTEFDADRLAVDSLISKGDCQSLLEMLPYENVNPGYVQGSNYRKEQTQKHCMKRNHNPV